MAKMFFGDEATAIINFSYNLRYMMQDKNTSSTKVAKKIGVSPNLIRSYVKAQAKPTEEIIRLIADALECEPSELTKTYNYRMSED